MASPATQEVYTDEQSRDWDWDVDGSLEGMYVEARLCHIKDGPSAGQDKLRFEFHLPPDDESVGFWETTVLKSKFREELKLRGKSDFEPGELITIRPTGKKKNARGDRSYRDFDIGYEYAAPRPSTLDLLAAGDEEPPDDEIAI
jgi:hypothetical protein